MEREVEFKAFFAEVPRPVFNDDVTDKYGVQSVGCYSLFGTDHGAGWSQTAVRILLETSSARRETGCADFGTVTIPLFRIQCRKDPPEILRLTSDIVNEAINLLKQSMLIAVKDKEEFEAKETSSNEPNENNEQSNLFLILGFEFENI